MKFMRNRAPSQRKLNKLLAPYVAPSREEDMRNTRYWEFSDWVLVLLLVALLAFNVWALTIAESVLTQGSAILCAIASMLNLTWWIRKANYYAGERRRRYQDNPGLARLVELLAADPEEAQAQIAEFGRIAALAASFDCGVKVSRTGRRGVTSTVARDVPKGEIYLDF